MRKRAEKPRMDEENKSNSWQTPLRTALQGYEQQLLAARRLARFRARARLRDGQEARDPDPSEKRVQTVRTVAAELMNLLVFTGVSPEWLEETRQELNKALNHEFEFVFPPDANLCVYVRENGARRPLSDAEQRLVTMHLQHITRARVEKSMLTTSPREGIYC